MAGHSLSDLVARSRALPAHWRRRRVPEPPLHGWPVGSRPTPLLDRLDDAELEALNAMLRWSCFTVDGRGRRFGRPAWMGKRIDPQPIPDPRIVWLDEVVDLSDKSVLEVGCFEGVHTIALCDRAREVTAIDARIENIAKTAVRCALYDVRPRLAVVDIETEDAGSELWRHDVVHHVGVLYHLVDPVSHLLAVAAGVGTALLLDTHVARESEVDDEFLVDGRSLRVRRMPEGGTREVFSGMYPFSRWLRLDDILVILEERGLVIHEVDAHDERNGQRARLLARRA